MLPTFVDIVVAVTTSIVDVGDKRIRVTYSGELSPEAVSSANTELLGRLRGRTGVQILFDMTAVVASSAITRAKLVALQQSLVKSKARTAFLTDVPRTRGLALLILRLAEDDNGLVANTAAEAESWLTSEEERFARTKRVTQELLKECKS